VEKARIAVFSDDRDFVNSLARSWAQSGYSREFTVSSQQMNSTHAGDSPATNTGEQASSAAVPRVVLTDGPDALAQLPAGVVLAILVTTDAVPHLAQANSGMRVMWLERSAGWADVAAALAHETALRLEAQAQAAEAKQKLREAERFAALGRFIAEARHGLGNALTGVMGHSELLLLEAGKELEGETRAQVETIHAMSLKIHETFHRLSSLDVELRLAERQAEREQAGPTQ
jgi:signal transduction histidine kinase